MSAAASDVGDNRRAELLTSIVRVARAVFESKAASITIYDPDDDSLVFHAVDGEGSDTLVGTRFSASEGIAGYVLQSREPISVEDVQRDPRFARDVAESTGFVPRALMAAPLLSGDESIGVLSVLDRSGDRALGLADMDLLALLARQAALGLGMVDEVRETQAAMDGKAGGPVARLGGELERLPNRKRQAAVKLLEGLVDLLADPSEARGPRGRDSL